MSPPMKTHPHMSARQTYSIAHTAKCKLHMAADAPDRNLRFVLGHAFTLDKALVRIVEIENDDPPVEEIPAKPAKKEMPPTSLRQSMVADETDEAIDEDTAGANDKYDDAGDEGDEGLGLTRFPSASAAPPRMVPSTEEDSDEDDEPVSPPSLPQDFDYTTLMQGEEDSELEGLYEEVRSCDCHGKSDVKSSKMWSVQTPDAADQHSRKRLAVMQVEA